MSTLYATRLGPVPTDEGEGMVFLGILDDKLISAPSATAAAALTWLRAKAPPRTRLLCHPDLAMAGGGLGYAAAPPDEDVLAACAELAFVLAHPGIRPEPTAALTPLLQAAATFWEARPWERLPADTAIAVDVSGSVRGTFEATVMGARGEEFGLALYPAPGSIARLLAAIEAGRPDLAAQVDSVSLTFDEEPAFAARALQAWCGLGRVPITFAMRGGEPQAIHEAQAYALAVTLHTMAGMDGTPGELATQNLEGDGMTVSVTVQLPGTPSPLSRPTPAPSPPAGAPASCPASPACRRC